MRVFVCFTVIRKIPSISFVRLFTIDSIKAAILLQMACDLNSRMRRLHIALLAITVEGREREREQKGKLFMLMLITIII